jgi:hypothetical protein
MGESWTTAALLGLEKVERRLSACWGDDGYDTGWWQRGGRRLPCWVGRRLRCLEGESWTTAALLGWTTAALLSGKGMASRVGERRTTAALLGGRELEDGCAAWWERVGRRLPSCWMGES